MHDVAAVVAVADVAIPGAASILLRRFLLLLLLWLFLMLLLLWYLLIVLLFEQGLEPQATPLSVCGTGKPLHAPVTAWSVLIDDCLRHVLCSCIRDLICHLIPQDSRYADESVVLVPAPVVLQRLSAVRSGAFDSSRNADNDLVAFVPLLPRKMPAYQRASSYAARLLFISCALKRCQLHLPWVLLATK